MNSYWVALLRQPDGSAMWEVSHGHSREDAAQTLCGTGVLESIERRPEPTWNILAPVRGHPEGGYGGLYSARYHLLAGGTILGSLGELEYAAVPTIYGEDRCLTDEDGERITAIGEVELQAGTGMGTRRVFLEPLDESHALDLLNGKLLEWDAELKDRGLIKGRSQEVQAKGGVG